MDLNNRKLASRGSAKVVGYLLVSVALLISALALSGRAGRGVGPTARPIFTATPAHAGEAPGLRFRFVDSETDARINPDVLLVDGQDFTYSIANGQMEFPAEAKAYVVTVFKEGYESMDDVVIEATNGTFTEFRLLPSDWVSQADLSGATGLDAKSGRIVGYVRDSASGAPLAGASVRLEGRKPQAAADADGYFSLDYSVTTADNTNPVEIELATLRIDAEGYIPQERQYVQLFGGDVIKYLIGLDPMDPALRRSGSTPVQTIDERLSRGGAAAETDANTPNPPSLSPGTPENIEPDIAVLPGAPSTDSDGEVLAARSHTIRVGFNCSCSRCSTVRVMNLEDYARHVLPHEWISSWSMNSLQAGAVAVRSYAGFYILNPISRSYNICTTTCCQVYGSSTSGRTDQAVRATAGLFVLRGSRPFRAEYSAENNLAPPCRRNGFTGTCLSDAVCTGFRTNGHGRGMCQWGSQRWGSGAARSGGAKNRTWILNHYYKNNPGYRGLNLHLGSW